MKRITYSIRFWMSCVLCIPLVVHAKLNDMQKTKHNLKQVNTKIIQLQQTIAKTNTQRLNTQQELAKIEKQLHENEVELQKIQLTLAKKTQVIQNLTLQMDTLSSQLKKQQDQLAQLVKAHYQTHTTQPLTLLIKPNNLYSLDRLLTYYQYSMKAIKRSMQVINDTKAELTVKQTQLQQDIAEQDQLKQQLEQRKQKYTQDKQHRLVLIQNLNQDLQTKKQVLTTYQRDQANLTRLLSNLVQQSVVQTRHQKFTQLRHKLQKPVLNLSNNMKKMSQGLIFYGPEGTPVRAVSAGKVVFSDWLNGYGLLLIIDHGWGFMTLYANNQALFKRKGDMVNQGEQIAAMGHSGTLKENSLYFEIRHRGKVISAKDWLST